LAVQPRQFQPGNDYHRAQVGHNENSCVIFLVVSPSLYYPVSTTIFLNHGGHGEHGDLNNKKLCVLRVLRGKELFFQA
jgi:hypothetical protein